MAQQYARHKKESFFIDSSNSVYNQDLSSNRSFKNDVIVFLNIFGIVRSFIGKRNGNPNRMRSNIQNNA